MDLDPAILEALFTGPYGRLLALLWGAVWGSFFNVVIARLPRGMSLVRPGSHCFACGRAVAWYDNLPLLSYLLLRGRCRHCGVRFSPRHLLVEALVCGLSLLAHHSFVVGAEGPIGLRMAQFVVISLFFGLLTAITFIDLDTLRILDAITYPAIPACMALSLLLEPRHWWDGPLGGMAGYLTIRLIADGYQLLTGRLGMGYGDAKLLAMIGGLLGWQALLPTLFLASFQGSVIGIAALLWLRRGGAEEQEHRPDEEPEAGATASPQDEQESEHERVAELVQRAAEVQPRRRARPEAERSQHEHEIEDEDEDEDEPAGASLRHARVPFGPFLSLAAVEVVLLRPLISSYFPYLW